MKRLILEIRITLPSTSLFFVALSAFCFGGFPALVANAQTTEGSLQLCLAAAADGSPVYPTQTFITPIKELVAVFRLAKGEAYNQLTGTFIAVDVGAAAPSNYEITKTELQAQGKDHGKFVYRQPKPMPIGKYRLDVTADGKPWRSAEFTVVAADKPVEVKTPTDLLPLTKGQVWTYAFVQESSGGVKLSFPDLTPDADGKFHATVTLTVAGSDADGTHIELRRNDNLVFEEWWQLDVSGLTTTKRKQKAEVTVLDPAQVLWAWPLDTPRSWTYEPKDKSFQQEYRMWGPVPVNGPSGNALGYVVLTEQPPNTPTITVERHFLPGVGMVREIITTFLVGISRQEMVLTSQRQESAYRAGEWRESTE